MNKKPIYINSDTMRNKLSLHRFYKAMVEDELSFDELEALCLTMYKMGISPIKTIKAYLKKYEDVYIHTMYVDGNKCQLVNVPKRMDHEKATILVYMKEWGGEIISVKLKYYPALETVAYQKYPLINFTGVTLK